MCDADDMIFPFLLQELLLGLGWSGIH